MRRTKRTFTQDERTLVFDLWKQGTGFSDIGRIIEAKPGSVFKILREDGGIKPRPRRRNISHLTLSEREEFRVSLSAKMSIRAIAKQLGRSPSTISREVFSFVCVSIRYESEQLTWFLNIAALEAFIKHQIVDFISENASYLNVENNNTLTADMIEFSGSWSVLNKFDGYHVPHYHANVLVSGVFYVDVPKDLSEHDVSGHLHLGRVDKTPFYIERQLT